MEKRGFSGTQGILQLRRQIHWLVSYSLFFSLDAAHSYTGYGVILQLVSQIATEKDLKEAQAVLGEYIVTMPRLALLSFRILRNIVFAGQPFGGSSENSRRRNCIL